VGIDRVRRVRRGTTALCDPRRGDPLAVLLLL
jgi:hypothetical protein